MGAGGNLVVGRGWKTVDRAVCDELLFSRTQNMTKQPLTPRRSLLLWQASAKFWATRQVRPITPQAKSMQEFPCLSETQLPCWNAQASFTQTIGGCSSASDWICNAKPPAQLSGPLVSPSSILLCSRTQHSRGQEVGCSSTGWLSVRPL
jgi:hypothetical protein